MVHHQKQILKNSSAHFAGIYSNLKRTQLRGGHSACKGDYEAHARIIFSFNCRLAFRRHDHGLLCCSERNEDRALFHAGQFTAKNLATSLVLLPIAVAQISPAYGWSGPSQLSTFTAS